MYFLMTMKIRNNYGSLWTYVLGGPNRGGCCCVILKWIHLTQHACRQGVSTLSIKSGIVSVFVNDKVCSVILNCIFSSH